MRFSFDFTRDEYKYWLEVQGDDTQWDNPLEAYLLAYVGNQSLDLDVYSRDEGIEISGSTQEVGEWDEYTVHRFDMKFALPDWTEKLHDFYHTRADKREKRVSPEQALFDLAQLAPSSETRTVTLTTEHYDNLIQYLEVAKMDFDAWNFRYNSEARDHSKMSHWGQMDALIRRIKRYR